MKILYFGNICNYAYWFAKWARSLGIDAYALIEIDELIFTPEKEDSEYDKSNPPNWVKFYNPGSDLQIGLKGFGDKDLYSKLRGYDIIHTFTNTTSIAVSVFNLPFIYHNVGSFTRSTSLFKQQKIRALFSIKYYPIRWRFLKALNKSLAIVVSIPMDRFEVENSIFKHKMKCISVPYDALDAKNFLTKESTKKSDNVITFLMPSRQHWYLKGQDLVFEAINMLNIEQKKQCKFIIMDWGPDIIKSKREIRRFELTNLFEWMPMIPRTDLWKLMAKPKTVVIVEFCKDSHGGGLGGVSRDALAIGVPVVTFAREEVNSSVNIKPAPIFHAECNSSSIHEQIVKCLKLNNSDFEKIKSDMHEWIYAECHYENIIPQYIKLYEVIMSKT